MKIKSLRIPALPPSLRKLVTKRQLRRILPVAGGVVVVAAIIAFQMSLSGNDSKLVDIEAYKDHLRGQVTSEDGAPRDGRDPASQQQNSLASAASKPTGVGQRTDKPAAGVTGSHDHHASPEDVYGDPEKTRIGANGCYIDYGIPGEQCLPAHAATNGTLTCEGVRTHGGFKDGIKVTGEDHFKLDTNGNNIACDLSD